MGRGTEALRTVLGQFGLAELTDDLNDLYINQGITDIDTLLVAVEDTRAFQERFAGSRDPRTGQVILGPAAYVEYENFILSQYRNRGLPAPSRAEIGAIVQSRRSAAELAQDFEAYDALQASPFARDQFYLYTGIDPRAEGLLGLLTGQAPDIEVAYQTTLAGIDQAAYLKRFNERLSHPETALTADMLEQPEGLPPIVNFGGPVISRTAALDAIRRAQAANAARFRSGGAVAPTPGGRQPYSF